MTYETLLGLANDIAAGDMTRKSMIESAKAALAVETAEAKAARYELTIRAISTSTLSGADFGDWLQAACEDVLDGRFPECPTCGTAVHAGACFQIGEGE